MKIGDRVRFRTVLKGGPAMPFLANPRMVVFDDRTEQYLEVKRNWRQGDPVIQVLHGVTSKFLAEKGGSREDTLFMLNADDAELLERTAAGTPAAKTPEGEKAHRERIRIAALKKAAELGYKPVIMIRTPQGTVGLLPGSEFTEVRGRFTLVDGNMVVNAGQKPENVLGTILHQGEYGHITDGKCTKLPGILGRH